MNDSGQVVGYSLTNGNSVHPFLYSNGTMEDLGLRLIEDLGLPPGGTNGQASGINNSGQVTGDFGGFAGPRIFLYSNGAMQDLGAPFCSFGFLGRLPPKINNFRQQTDDGRPGE
jgi:probable HAF family extracellular repeat protein